MRDHWTLLFVPLGFSATLYSNSLYETSHHHLSWVLFLGGWVVTICGMPAFKRFLDEIQIREENEKVAWLGFFLVGTVGGPVFTAAKAIWGVAQPQPDDYLTAAVSLGLTYLLLPLAVRWIESKDFTLGRLPGRIQRAAIFRTIANAAGIGAVATFLSARFVVDYPAPLISTALTLMVAMVVVTHKTFARARKLCTQTHTDVQNLLRDMEDLDDAKDRDRAAKKRMAARRSWDVLKLDLCTTVDSGYRLLGLPFLTRDAIADLENKVLDRIKATDPDATDPARDDLRAILDACAGRIDVLA